MYIILEVGSNMLYVPYYNRAEAKPAFNTQGRSDKKFQMYFFFGILMRCFYVRYLIYYQFTICIVLRYLEIRYLVYYQSTMQTVIYQAPNLQEPHYYANMVRLCLCSAAIRATKRKSIWGFSIRRTRCSECGSMPMHER